jgi:hypothetical protein
MLEFVGGSSFRNIDVIQGPVKSDVAQPIAVTAGALKIPEISHFASSETLSNKLVYPFFFRTIPSDAQRAEAIAALFQQYGYRKVGIIYLNDAFGVSWKNSLFLECEKRKIRLISVLYDSGVKDSLLDDQVNKALRVLVSEKINVIVHISLTTDFISSLAKAAKSLNWITGKLYISHTTYNKAIIQGTPDPKLLLEFLNGSLAVMAGVEDNAHWRSLRQAWPNTNVTEVNQVLPQGTTTTGKPYALPADFFRKGQEQLLYKSWALAYDSVVAIGLAACGSAPTLAENMAKLDFVGTSGRIKFSSTYNRDPGTLSFVLVNTISGEAVSPYDQIKTKEVGVLKAGNWTFSQPIIFSDGSSVPPIDVKPPVHVIDSIPLGAQIFGWIEAFLAILAGLCALFFVYFRQKDQVIIESQPVFMGLLACGCVILASSIVPLTFETDAGCMLFPWLFALGFTLSLSSLTAKSVRVAILWYHRGPITKRNKSVRAKVLIIGMCVVMAIEVAILITWQVIAPLEFAVITTQFDADGNPLYSSAICTSDSTQTTILFAMLVVYICLVVFGTMWVSFWVRNAPEKYQEAKMTAVAGVCMFQVFFVGLPAAAAVWNMALPKFLVLSSITFLLCMIILVTMFVPKAFKSSFSGMNSTPPNSLNNQASPEPTGEETRRDTRNSKRIRSDVQAVRSDQQKVSDVQAVRSDQPEQSAEQSLDQDGIVATESVAGSSTVMPPIAHAGSSQVIADAEVNPNDDKRNGKVTNIEHRPIPENGVVEETALVPE